MRHLNGYMMKYNLDIHGKINKNAFVFIAYALSVYGFLKSRDVI